jgi:DNA-binding FadR family transcriptional regulator
LTNQALRLGGGRQRPARLAVAVVSDLIDAVVSGRIAVGQALPGEQALCDEFEVSRIVIREALQSLERKGLVLIRQGHGTVVSPPDRWDPLDEDVLDARIRHDDALTVLDSLIRVRVALECELAAAAATAMSPDGVAELRQLLADMEVAIDDPERYMDFDLRFHDLVMAASGNDIGRAVVSKLHGHARASTRYSGGKPEPEHLRHAQRGHTAIAAAIAEGDADGAAAAMRAHILESWRLKTDLKGSPQT